MEALLIIPPPLVVPPANKRGHHEDALSTDSIFSIKCLLGRNFFVSHRETVTTVTPIRRASSDWLHPCLFLTSFNLSDHSTTNVAP